MIRFQHIFPLPECELGEQSKIKRIDATNLHVKITGHKKRLTEPSVVIKLK